MKTLLVTGGAGFIGSEVVLQGIASGKWRIINVDKLTYSGNPASLASVEKHPAYQFAHADIANAEAMATVFAKGQPDAVMNLAAESHVDRSIDNPGSFIDTNIKGTYILLEAARNYWKKLKRENPGKAADFRFLHISTDEVFGDLASASDLADCQPTYFTEKTAYAPSSPYSASKAASDHLVRAWKRTYDLPTLITNCSNNYGPRQFPEKLIPLTLINALAGKPLPVYGDGRQIRDWLYVSDHVKALYQVIEKGTPGETYAIGGHNEKMNIEVVGAICDILETLRPDKPANIKNYRDLITFVKDRPGHDGRYAIDPAKIERDLGWHPDENFESGMRKTVQWYLDNENWWRSILAGTYQGQRLGTNI